MLYTWKNLENGVIYESFKMSAKGIPNALFFTDDYTVKDYKNRVVPSQECMKKVWIIYDLIGQGYMINFNLCDKRLMLDKNCANMTLKQNHTSWKRLKINTETQKCDLYIHGDEIYYDREFSNIYDRNNHVFMVERKPVDELTFEPDETNQEIEDFVNNDHEIDLTELYIKSGSSLGHRNFVNRLHDLQYQEGNVNTFYSFVGSFPDELLSKLSENYIKPELSEDYSESESDDDNNGYY